MIVLERDVDDFPSEEAASFLLAGLPLSQADIVDLEAQRLVGKVAELVEGERPKNLE